MNKILFAMVAVLLVASFVSGCRKEDANNKIVEGRFSAMNNHDVAALASFYADSVRGESTGWSTIFVGAPAVCQAYGRYFKSSPDLTYHITRVLDAGRSVVVEFTSEGTILNNEQGVPEYMRGKHYILKNCTILDIEQGKIVRESTYFDQLSFLRQTGYFDQHQ
ncbi:MAG: nuclear transport factor 2 family protein [Bacteroidota bacterium]